MKLAPLILLILCFFINKINSFAQFSDEYLKYKLVYPNENKVCLNATTTFSISIAGDDLKIEEQYTEENIYLNSNANHFSEDELSYSSFIDLKNIKASSFSFKDGKYKENIVKKFVHKDNLSNSVFHDDSKKVTFLYSNLEEGAKTSLSYHYLIKSPYILPKTFFSYSYPTVKSTFIIVADKDIEIAYNLFNTDSLDINYTSESKNGKTIYTWAAKNINGIRSESNSVGYNYYLPHIIPRIVSYKIKNTKTTILESVSDLHKWYYSLIKNINKQPPDEKLIELVQTLTKEKTTEIEKVKAMYYWVQQNIKYVAFEYELGGFIPRESNDIFNKKYGDCKDNSSLLQKMLEIAGIKSYLTWIGTNDLPYSYSKVPTPASDNHMILTYFQDSIPFFLDATGRFNPIESPSTFIQGKEALISIDSNTFLIKQVPIIDAKKNYVTDSIYLKIENLNLIGEGRVLMNNYSKMDYFNALEGVKTKDDLLSFYNKNFEKGNNKFLITDFSEENKYDYNKEFKVNYNFKVENYVLTSSNELYVNLNLNKSLMGFITKKEHKLDKEFNFKNYRKYQYILSIPNGYEVSYIPSSFSYNTNFFSSNLSYKIENDKIMYEHTIETNFIILTKKNQEEFNLILNEIKNAYNESIVLKKIK